MHSRPPYRPAGDRVYQAIKARLIAYDFPQGKRIYLEPIAESLGVSTTPVREAMNRLAERDLVIKAENKGFYAITLSEERLRGNYEVTRLLLLLGLEDLERSESSRLSGHVPTSELANRLDRRVITDAGSLARYTGCVFGSIALLIDNSTVQHHIELASDHLYFVRTLECHHIASTQEELKCFCKLLLSGKKAELRSAIQQYHDRRLALLGTLLRQQGREAGWTGFMK